VSVHDLASQDDFTRDEVGPAAGMCFYCGDEVQGIAVAWKGCAVSHDALIALHPLCAQRLALHLAKDGLLAELAERAA
jgi:hypothetical protein